MPAVICYVSYDNREVQLRVRLLSRRVAIPFDDLPWPQPLANLMLFCPDFTAELKYAGSAHGFAVYYTSSIDFEFLVDLIRRLCPLEPCQLPCVLRP
jgi:hypothetical protein